MNISFAGCGFLGIYHIGVASCLREYAPILYRTRIAGASAGAICACALLCGCSLGKKKILGQLELLYEIKEKEKALNLLTLLKPKSGINKYLSFTGDGTTEVLKLAVNARSRTLGPFHPFFDLVGLLRKGLEAILPENAHVLCSGRLFISLTRWKDYKNVIVSEYDSKQDLIQAVICSSFIPIYSGLRIPVFHGIQYFDGSFTNNLPVLNEHTITVSPFCGESDICPKDYTCSLSSLFVSNTSIALSHQNVSRILHILYPAHPDALNTICKQGFEDALRYLSKNSKLIFIFYPSCTSMKFNFLFKSADLISCTQCLEVTSSIDVRATTKQASSDNTHAVQHKNVPEQSVEHKNVQEQSVEHINVQEQSVGHKNVQEQPVDPALESHSCSPEVCQDSIQAAADSLDKGIVNWIFNRRPIKLISLLTAPYFLPIDITYICFLKVWNSIPELRKEILQNLRHVMYLVQQTANRVNKERHKYSAKFSYEMAITEIDQTEIDQLTSGHYYADQNPSQELKDLIAGNGPMVVAEKVLDSICVKFDVDIPDSEVSRHNSMDIVDAIKVTGPTNIPPPRAAIDISNKALARECERLFESNSSTSEFLNQAASVPEQHEAIFSYSYLDNNRKTVKITQIYDVKNIKKTNEFSNSELQQSDPAWSEVRNYDSDSVDKSDESLCLSNESTKMECSLNHLVSDEDINSSASE
ncbi:Patanin-like phospholipase domain-containing protein [Nymphon striatum]|nr:Patanin-like phospholipase domain-containing protein [Nymphon striatum]